MYFYRSFPCEIFALGYYKQYSLNSLFYLTFAQFPSHTSMTLILLGLTYCNGTWDRILCWPAAKPGEIIRQQCPPIRGLDQTSEYSNIANLDPHLNLQCSVLTLKWVLYRLPKLKQYNKDMVVI